MNERDIFTRALDMESPAERAAFLDAACAGDAALRARIEALLGSHEHAGSFLVTAHFPAEAPPQDEPPDDAVGTRVGPYKLLQQIGQGGMGTVYMAEQAEPVHRLVAVKIIKPGMDSQQVVARFEAERQALALMDHPNIAKVLDAGSTDAGRPYFVMELVKGVPITRYCDEHRLTPRQRLELFVPVCQAVQHAHQKGIIHRDLKPSNVLVAQYDGRPVPKVIDFGVAKATGPKLTDHTLFTEFGQLVGTLEYMSPEQAELNQLDIDTRSDVYALGVILYELLTGTTPLAPKRVKQAALLEVLRLIREEEPPRPSTRLSTTEELPSIAAQRGLEPRKLSGLVRGELDWIVMKCLEKDRNRRYETANGLAMDVQRYLADEPVEACPPSATYRLQKFVRRNRGPVIAAGVVALALLGGIAGTTVGMVRARDAERLAAGRLEDVERAKEATEDALKRSEASRERADLSDRQSGAVADYMVATFRVASPAARGPEVKAIDMLDDAVTRLQAETAMDAKVKIRVLRVLAGTLQDIGLAARALPLREEARTLCVAAYGPRHPETLLNVTGLSNALAHLRRYGEAAALAEEALNVQREVLGPKHADTLASMHNLALARGNLGRRTESLAMHDECLRLKQEALGPDDPRTIASLFSLALLHFDMGRRDEGVRRMEDVVRLSRAKLGPENPEALIHAESLANFYGRVGRHADSAVALEAILTVRKTRYGLESRRTLVTMHNLAQACRKADRRAEATAHFEQVFPLMKAKFGPNERETLICGINLGLQYGETGRADKALPVLEDTLARLKAAFGPDDPDTLDAMSSLAGTLRELGRAAEGLTLHEEVYRRRVARHGPEADETLHSLSNVAAYYLEAGRVAEAVPMLEQAAKIRRTKFGPDHPGTWSALLKLSDAYRSTGRAADAAPLLDDVYQSRRKRLGPDHASTLFAQRHLGATLRDAGRLPDAEAMLRSCLEVASKKNPDDWATFYTQSLLGSVLVAAKQFDAAEPLVLAGYEGMKQREAKLTAPNRKHLTEANKTVIRLYDESGQKDKAEEWRKKLDVPNKPAGGP